MAQTANVYRSLEALLREVLHGPPAEAAFVLNPGDRGLLASLDTLTAEAASARPGGRSSVAAHADHLRFGLDLFNRWAKEENPWADANFSESWTLQHVTDVEWRDRRKALADAAREWEQHFAEPRQWDDMMLTAAVGVVVHLAYHLGAIRQLVQAASGPRASD
jgi:hypothetical protein